MPLMKPNHYSGGAWQGDLFCPTLPGLFAESDAAGGGGSAEPAAPELPKHTHRLINGTFFVFRNGTPIGYAAPLAGRNQPGAEDAGPNTYEISRGRGLSAVQTIEEHPSPEAAIAAVAQRIEPENPEPDAVHGFPVLARLGLPGDRLTVIIADRGLGSIERFVVAWHRPSDNEQPRDRWWSNGVYCHTLDDAYATAVLRLSNQAASFNVGASICDALRRGGY